MHISEGVLPAWEVAVGWVLTLGGLFFGLKSLKGEKVVLAALLASLFFVASLIHINVGVGSVHLVMNGIIGLLLGWGAFPAVFIALLFQAILLQFGGLAVLGINTFNLAFPAVIAHFLFKEWVKKGGWQFYTAAFLSAFIAVFGSGFLITIELTFAGEEFIYNAIALLLLHLPVATVEGIIYISTLGFIKTVYPHLLEEIL